MFTLLEGLVEYAEQVTLPMNRHGRTLNHERAIRLFLKIDDATWRRYRGIPPRKNLRKNSRANSDAHGRRSTKQ